MSEQKEPPKKTERVPKTDEELKQLAKDIYAGKVFTDRQIPEGEKIEQVFMGLALGGPQLIERLREEKVCLMYQYMSEAAPMAINGLPGFFTFHYLIEEEVERLQEYYKKVCDAMEGI